MVTPTLQDLERRYAAAGRKARINLRSQARVLCESLGAPVPVWAARQRRAPAVTPYPDQIERVPAGVGVEPNSPEIADLRAWRSARGNRALRIQSTCVTLLELDSQRFAEFTTPAAALAAISTDAIRWRDMPRPMNQR